MIHLQRIACNIQCCEWRSLGCWVANQGWLGEASHHKGDFKVALIDAVLGYYTRMAALAIPQMPPGSLSAFGYGDSPAPSPGRVQV